MPSIICGSLDCKYNGYDCKCMADKVKFTYRNMATVNEGRVDMWVCDKYSMDDESKRILEELEIIMKGRKKNELQ